MIHIACRVRPAFKGEANEIIPQENTVIVPPHEEYHFDRVLGEKCNILEEDPKNAVILFYGATGTGKTTSFHKALAEIKTREIPETYTATEMYNGKVQELASGPFSSDDIQRALGKRKVEKTLANEQSSRGHCFLTLKMKSGNICTLIDLAGCERLSQSGSSHERRTEAIHVNRSLTALRDVIESLAKKKPFIPWRNSPLTQLIKSFMHGHPMFIIVLCCNRDRQLSVETLKFGRSATRISRCTHIPEIKEEEEEEEDYEKELHNCRLELERMRKELEEKEKRSVKCSQCGCIGHNKRTCKVI